MDSPCPPTAAAYFDCRAWAEQDKGQPLSYVFFGRRADVAAKHNLYALVERAFDTETAAFHASQLYPDRRGERRAFQLGLRTAMIAKLETLHQERAARFSSGRDLVAARRAMIEAELEKLGLDFHYRDPTLGRRVVPDAFEAGEQAGARFEGVAGVTQAA